MTKKMIQVALVMGAGMLLTGCASITSDTTQLVRVDALNKEGEVVVDATCEVANNKGTFQVSPGKSALVGKSGEDLTILCQSVSRTDLAQGVAISRPGAGIFGNIILGGGIGALVDHNTGAAYYYPEWMQVEFGETLTFDRTDHNDGVPLKGKKAS